MPETGRYYSDGRGRDHYIVRDSGGMLPKPLPGHVSNHDGYERYRDSRKSFNRYASAHSRESHRVYTARVSGATTHRSFHAAPPSGTYQRTARVYFPRPTVEAVSAASTYRQMEDNRQHKASERLYLGLNPTWQRALETGDFPESKDETFTKWVTPRVPVRNPYAPQLTSRTAKTKAQSQARSGAYSARARTADYVLSATATAPVLLAVQADTATVLSASSLSATAPVLVSPRTRRVFRASTVSGTTSLAGVASGEASSYESSGGTTHTFSSQASAAAVTEQF